jgi:hypothetical protein
VRDALSEGAFFRELLAHMQFMKVTRSPGEIHNIRFCNRSRTRDARLAHHVIFEIFSHMNAKK